MNFVIDFVVELLIISSIIIKYANTDQKNCMNHPYLISTYFNDKFNQNGAKIHLSKQVISRNSLKYVLKSQEGVTSPFKTGIIQIFKKNSEKQKPITEENCSLKFN